VDGHSPPRLLLAVPNVTAHPSTASVPITVTVRCSAVLMCPERVNLEMCGMRYGIFFGI